MKQPQDEQSSLKFNEYSSLPGWAHSLAAIGKATERTIHLHLERLGASSDVLAGCPPEEVRSLANALGGWTDEPASELVDALLSLGEQGRELNLAALARWVLLHPNDYSSVRDCMELVPPQEVDIVKVLSRAGSQKLVFEATWRLTQRRVVVKKLTGAPDAIVRVLGHESNSHPLSISHPNIIETHVLRNSRSEAFLVERWLPEVLSDTWACQGVQQVANLLHCLADAVAYVHSVGKVHGDIKPDNIGKEDDRFILLDFGICRKISEFSKEITATGSLRTRAPELLLSDSYSGDATKVDMWAIGATIYNFLAGRFPLIDREEKIPRITQMSERQAFEAELARRVREEWDRRVVIGEKVPEPFRDILAKLLDKDPTRRPSAGELKILVGEQLSVYIPHESTSEPFAPIDELAQLRDYLPPPEVLGLMPADERTRFKNRIARLKTVVGFERQHIKKLEEIEYLLNA